MKKLLVIVAVGTAVASCKKCHDCHYDSPAGEVEIGEYCGDDLKDIEDDGYTVDGTVYTVHCEEH